MAEEKTSPVRRLERTLTQGNLWLYVLSLLKKNNEYAYTMQDKIEKKFGWKPGLILNYVVLYRLENERLITSKFEGRRKYYALTGKGRKTLKEGKKLIAQTGKKL
ncbi:PadR family transcriptional regulator [Candidatus Micrarchaeota archaeon]|nr:PadR family transcriptional regulator [Candidatus Micrarchaeota archaeon]